MALRVAAGFPKQTYFGFGTFCSSIFTSIFAENFDFSVHLSFLKSWSLSTLSPCLFLIITHTHKHKHTNELNSFRWRLHLRHTHTHTISLTHNTYFVSVSFSLKHIIVLLDTHSFFLPPQRSNTSTTLLEHWPFQLGGVLRMPATRTQHSKKRAHAFDWHALARSRECV